MSNTINIRPTVGYLGVLSRINYTPYHAMAEFLDNSIQSYVDNKTRLKKLHSNYKLKIDINVSSNRKLISIFDVLGRERKGTRNEPLFYIYDDGTVKKQIIIE